MCGITGWVSFERDLGEPGHRADAEAMTATMACRGPDAEGLHVERHAALGHRRLAVIDVEGGAQPMSVRTDDGEVVLLHSGEVYGFEDLRAELVRRGHRFRTRSDTEVVLHGYLEWGEAVAEHLDGMFASAIWDGRVERLVLVRDRLGIKPLYYAETPDGVLFGSESKALLANPLGDRTVDLDGMRSMLSLAVPPGASLWRGMREVLPGGLVVVDRDGLREHRYWTLATRPHTDDLPTTLETVRGLLEDVVAHQTVSDVPRCTLLSGGLDSSVLTALAAKALAARGEQVRSFAVDFVGEGDGEGATPDSPFATEVAEHVGTRHERIVLDHLAMADPSVRRAVIASRDSPVTWGDIDSSMYLLFRAIREHSTVALSGEGADELFGGYEWFTHPERRAHDSFPWMEVLVRRSQAQLSSRLSGDLRAALDLPAFVDAQYASAVAEVGHLDGEGEQERRYRVMSYLAVTRIERSLLERKDRLSMAVGLEVRVPFCDHRLVEYVYNVPWALKSYDGHEKSLLRGAAGDLLPASVRERRKLPYPANPDHDYTRALLQQGADLLAEGHPVLELVDDGWLRDVVRQDPAETPLGVRAGVERVLGLGVWLDLYQPRLVLG
ncbi:asparagine synthase (glutamine-hydrolyzing) [Pseudokineococcus sp. 5B2Z-1]|uniref:asparagine synthase (glutamine-hydrolyzing) n=1 Tax=Pseudokineococcus sp. 5B2Z-1 TaxID=3132744 RepID=UPI0030B026FC